MPSLGAIVLGIAAYNYAAAEQRAPPLHFASLDAEAMEGYLRTCWAGDREACICRITQSAATTRAVNDAFSTLANQGTYELLIVYLSGHGFASATQAGFLLQPLSDPNGNVLLTPAALDELLASVGAARVVFILDCCFAEAIVKQMRFFSHLDGAEARLFIASSRADQLTWEEASAGHGVFTALLLDLLNAGNSAQLPGTRDTINVDAELFPFLCDQVPLYVLEHKAARQEPVKGGVATSPVLLPVARLARRLRNRTSLGTALQRIRQIGSAIAGGIAVCVILAYAFLYYAEADSSGEIILRHGTRWLEPVLAYFPTVRVRTGIGVDELSLDATARYPVQSGSLVGIWTQSSRSGYRSWYDEIAAALNAGARERYQALLGPLSSPERRLPDPMEARPSEVEFVAWANLLNYDGASSEWAISAIPGSDRLKDLASPFPKNKLDFSVLDLTPQQLASYARALIYLAIADPDRAFPAYLGFVMVTQEWLYQNRNSERWSSAREKVVDSVSAVLPAIAASRADRGLPPLAEGSLETLEGLAERGYFEVAGTALARTQGVTARGTRIRQLALSRLTGDSFEDDQLWALRIITYMLDGSPDAKASTQTVYDFFGHAGAQENSFLTKFMIDAADRHSLPLTLQTLLLHRAADAIRRQDREFIDQEYARILAHAMPDIAAPERSAVYHLIEVVASDTTPMAGALAEIYGVLGKHGLDQPQMLKKVLLQSSAALKKLAPVSNPPTDDLPGISIGIDWPAWAIALAEFGRNRQLPAEGVAMLRKFATYEPLRPFRATFELAVVKQLKLIGASCAREPSPCLSKVGQPDSDSSAREMETAMVARLMTALPRERFLTQLSSLQQRRSREVEPEVRIGLGAIIVDSQILRVSSPPI